MHNGDAGPVPANHAHWAPVPRRGERVSPEQRERISQRNAARWEDSPFRATATDRLRAAWKRRGGRTAEDRARIGERSRRMWRDPAFKARMGRQIALGWENRHDISNPTTEEVPSLQAHRRLAAAP